MFLAPNFFGGAPPEFLEWDYKIRPDSDHVPKFHGDRSRELGERVAKKKHLGQNISPSGTAVPVGLMRAATVVQLASLAGLVLCFIKSYL